MDDVWKYFLIFSQILNNVTILQTEILPWILSILNGNENDSKYNCLNEEKLPQRVMVTTKLPENLRNQIENNMPCRIHPV